MSDTVKTSGSAGNPWYRRCFRWGQTNLTEVDPIRYDAEWWRGYWRRTRVQGVIVNAGGIVAYYPSKYPLHHRAVHLGDRDLYGEIVSAAREDGLAVLARMDSNRAGERFYIEHPDWFAVDAEGRPYRSGDLYIACVNSPYYDEFLIDVLREIIERSQPDGVTDNSWSGLDRGRICYCIHCQRAFQAATGESLPAAHDWNNPVYRSWIRWSYARRVEIWELNNRVTQEAGGEDCLWIGMNGGDLISQSLRFRDYKALCERTEIIMLDSQRRENTRGFQANGEMGKVIHGLMGWDKLIPESMAMYGAGQPTFRVGSKPEPEARMWAVEGFAGGIQPWWHHIGAYHEDRRQYRTAEPLFCWHEEHEHYLVNRQPVTTVGVVWSQENIDFYGRDAPEERFGLPWRGMTNALIRARIPYLPVHADHIERDAARHGLQALALPNVGILTDAQCNSIRQFVAGGGGVLATGETSRYDDDGNSRPDFALGDLFGISGTGAHHGSAGAADPSWEEWSKHSYLRITPELRRQVDGPQVGSEPPIGAPRHEVLHGFDETDLLPFAGRIEVVHVTGSGSSTPLYFVPPFPIYPPETSWMRHQQTDLPGLVLRDRLSDGGRVAYLAADIDRCYGRDNMPDHADLLQNLVRWTAGGAVPLEASGAGLVDCHLYSQDNRLILHLVNLSNATWRAPVDELLPVGPISIRVNASGGVGANSARLLVSGSNVEAATSNGMIAFEVESIRDHEVVVIE